MSAIQFTSSPPQMRNQPAWVFAPPVGGHQVSLSYEPPRSASAVRRLSPPPPALAQQAYVALGNLQEPLSRQAVSSERPSARSPLPQRPMTIASVHAPSMAAGGLRQAPPGSASVGTAPCFFGRANQPQTQPTPCTFSVSEEARQTPIPPTLQLPTQPQSAASCDTERSVGGRSVCSLPSGSPGTSHRLPRSSSQARQVPVNVEVTGRQSAPRKEEPGPDQVKQLVEMVKELSERTKGFSLQDLQAPLQELFETNFARMTTTREEELKRELDQVREEIRQVKFQAVEEKKRTEQQYGQQLREEVSLHTAAREDNSKMLRELEDKERNVAELQRKLKSAVQLQVKIESLEAQNEQKSAEIRRLDETSKKCETLQQANSKLQATLSEYQSRFEALKDSERRFQTMQHQEQNLIEADTEIRQREKVVKAHEAQVAKEKHELDQRLRKLADREEKCKQFEEWCQLQSQENERRQQELETLYHQGRNELDKDNQQLRQALQSAELRLVGLENELQTAKERANPFAGMTPGNVKRLLKTPDGENLSKVNSDLHHDVSGLKEEVKWLCWHSEILKSFIPPEQLQEAVLTIRRGWHSNEWQMPKEYSSWLAAAGYPPTGFMRRGGSLGGC
jgi:predicted  nucleic acid-binding Zn-ribbon protein